MQNAQVRKNTLHLNYHVKFEWRAPVCQLLPLSLRMHFAGGGLPRIAQEYTLKPEATMKNLTFLEEIVVVNGVPLPRMQSLVMTSLLKHNSDFIMLLPDPC